MNCREAKRLLRLRATKLPVEGANDLGEHLLSCDRCHRGALGIELVDRVLVTVHPPEPANDFLENLIAGVNAETKDGVPPRRALTPRLSGRQFRWNFAIALCGILVGAVLGGTMFPREGIVFRSRIVPVVREREVRVEVPVVREKVVTRLVRVGQASGSHGARFRELAGARERTKSGNRAGTLGTTTPRIFPMRVTSTKYFLVESIPPPAIEPHEGSEGGGILVFPVRREMITAISQDGIAQLLDDEETRETDAEVPLTLGKDL